MKNLIKKLSMPLLFGLAVALSFGQTRFEMPMVGESLPITKFEIVNKIPNSHLKLLPKSLPIFRYSSKPRDLSITALQMLLDQTPFAGTNITDLLQGQTNLSQIQEPIRLATAQNLDSFFVSPSRGSVSINVHEPRIDINNPPPYDAVPNFDSIRERVFHYAELFGVSTNELERKDDGSIMLHRADGKISKLGGAITYINQRSVGLSRSIRGHIFHLNDEKVDMTLGINGRLLKFELNWRPMEAVHTNRLFTITEILDNIKKGQVLGELVNEYPEDGIAKIILNDIRIDYYTPPPPRFQPVSTNADIYPIASFYVTFQSKSGKSEDGGLFVPIIEAQ